MPRVDDLLKRKNENKKFKKSQYRPWNFMEKIEQEVRLKVVESLSDNNRKDLLNNNNDKKEEFTKENDNFLDKISRLSGYQKSIFTFIVNKCTSRGLLSTGPVTSDDLSIKVGTTKKMIKTSIYRLVKKDLIIRNLGKQGRGGFYTFSISEDVRNSYLKLSRIMDVSLIEHKINNTDENDYFKIKSSFDKLSDQWKSINFDPIKDIGFTMEHIVQLSNQIDLSPEIVQNSIYYYAFDLKKNEKKNEIKKTTPLGFFMGILKNVGPYTAPVNYESPQDEAIRIYFEREREIKNKRQKIEKEAINLAFEKWFKEESDSNIKKLIPATIKYSRNSKLLIETAKVHFKEVIWPKKKKEFAFEDKSTSDVSQTKNSL